jgi:hydroxyacylglutathione hydrolase
MHNIEINIIKSLIDNYIYVITCKKTSISAVIDPGSSEEVINFIDKNALNIKYILNTHHHYDHINGNDEIKAKYNCKIIAYQHEKKITNIDIRVKESDMISIGKIKFKIIHLPGHTNNHIAYYSKEENLLFSGDVLFSSGCGKIFEGTYKEMYYSLEKIKNLPLKTKIYASHEYTKRNIEFALTLEPNNKKLQEKYYNTKNLLAKNIPTLPTNLANELYTNPFLRTLNKELRTSIGKNSDSYNIEIFQKIRELKDNF